MRWPYKIFHEGSSFRRVGAAALNDSLQSIFKGAFMLLKSNAPRRLQARD